MEVHTRPNMIHSIDSRRACGSFNTASVESETTQKHFAGLILGFSLRRAISFLASDCPFRFVPKVFPVIVSWAETKTGENLLRKPTDRQGLVVGCERSEFRGSEGSG